MLLPIETKVRELYGKCLLAVIATEAGLPVILGDLRVLAHSTHWLPAGVYLDKSASRTKTAHYARLKQLGFAVAAWCEEGLVYRDKHAYQMERVSPNSLAHLDAFFAWGDVHRQDMVEVVPEAADKIHVTGNPRFDVLRPEYRVLFEKAASTLAERYGPYILVNTNFARFNHFRDESVVSVLRKRGILVSGQDERFYHRLAGHLGGLFNAFADLVPAIARAFPQTTIVVRPHPSENHEQWRASFQALPNVSVVHEGSVIPWIIGAKAVVHNSCTTGVEAFLLNRRTIAYLPITDPTLDSRLPNGLSEVAHGVEAALELLREAIETGRCERQDSPERQALLARYIGNAERSLASEDIVAVLLALAERSASRGSKNYLGRALSAGRAVARLAARRLRHDHKMTAYNNQKFPGISASEVESIVAAIAKVRNSSVPRVSPHPSLSNCFVIEPQPRRLRHEVESTPRLRSANLHDADLPAA